MATDAIAADAAPLTSFVVPVAAPSIIPAYGSRCSACRFLRRKCIQWYIFAPYFCHEEGVTDFEAIHKVFGARNASNLLTYLPVKNRYKAVTTILYDA